ncbi:hypothetical protein JQC91_06190 [Jannaschia sp. Os4]|uniref:hypothetical protein n=1 Tax=Jannaschia sp. Os4 TaxID=2807617 RepID=UPI0019393F15|nr:hypothetical protein [Jannaschia sp. Os4]MBM2575887.1 hypothetical protein [Jannaschia sp. Os4]
MPQSRLETAFWTAAAAALLALAVLGWWAWAAVAAACLALTALLPAFTAVSGLRFPVRLTVGVAAFCAGALLFGELGDGYEMVPWWDMALHVVSMAALAVVGTALALLPTGGARPRTPVWVLATLAFGFAMMVGALWEVMEFGLDAAFGFETQDTGLDDTMWDVIANAVGALWGAAAGAVALVRGRGWVPGGLLLDWIALNPVLYPLWSGPFEAGRRPLPGEDRALQRGG